MKWEKLHEFFGTFSGFSLSFVKTWRLDDLVKAWRRFNGGDELGAWWIGSNGSVLLLLALLLPLGLDGSAQ